MNSIQIIASLTTGVGLLILALAIPLIRGRVPPNGIYGIRTKAAFASRSDWYRINSLGGRYLAVSGLVILIFGGIGFFLSESARDGYSIAAAIVTLLAVLVPCIRLCAQKPSGTSDNDHGKA
jgi:hypothetical protein